MIDYCVCVKDSGEWCEGGWHFKTQDEGDCVRWADFMFRSRFGEKINRLDSEWIGLHALAQRYIGRPLAVVQCPHYQRAAADRAPARTPTENRRSA
jgi:hypothetical protein